MYSPQRRPTYQRTYGAPQATAAAPLLGSVLGITGAGFIVTAVTSYLTQGFPYGASLIAMLVGFGFLIGITATRRNPALSMLMFYAFTACEGIGIGPIIGRYVQVDGSGIVVNAAATTAAGMLVVGGLAYLSGIDYRKLSGVAFGALIALLIVGVITMFTHFVSPTIYSWGVLVVFSLLVFVDFARIRAGGGGATAIELATQIYLDAVNIFLALLRIFGGNRD